MERARPGRAVSSGERRTRRAARLVLAFALVAAAAPAHEAAAQSSPAPAPSTEAPLESPAPSPSATLSPAPAPSTSASPLGLSKTRLQLPPNSESGVLVSGGVAPYAARISSAVADVRIDPASGALSLRALASGSATLTVTDAAQTTVTASVLVAPSAGFVPLDLAVALIGKPSSEFILAAVRAALERAARPLPGARVAIADPSLTVGMNPGERLDTAVRVHLDGAGRYVDVDGIANVHVTVTAAEPIVPTTLYYSDDPEKIDRDGILFRGTLSAGQFARLYYYHQAANAGREIAILLDAPAGTAQVRVVGRGAGPNGAVMFVGQSATFRYLDDEARGAGVALDVPVGAPVELFTGDRPLAPGDLVAGALDLAVVTGDPVRVTVAALSEAADLRTLLGGEELATDGKYRRGEYALGAPELPLAYRVGAPEPAPFVVGGLPAALPNARPGGRPLAGDYGLLRSVDLRFSNPTNEAATVYLYEQPIGYPVTTTILFDGEPAPTRVQCVKTAANRYLVRAFSVAANADERVTGTYMTDGASTYPLAFGLTATPPSAPPATMTSPDGCFPKPAPAVPSAPP